ALIEARFGSDMAAEVAACIVPELAPRAGILDEKLRPPPGATAEVPASIFVTGATGFLGRFLVAELLMHSSAQLTCLVRGSSREGARRRLLDTLERADIWDSSFESRLEVVVGDIGRPRLGLTQETWEALANSTESVIHLGAEVNLLVRYRDVRAAN